MLCRYQEQKKLLKQSSPDLLTIIDVRSPEEYAEKHIPGAINIPLSALETRSKQFSKEAIIVTVCGKGGGRSALGAEVLKRIGFINPLFLCGGTLDWFEKNT